MDFFTTDYIAFFLIVALGLALGKLKIKGLSLDISAIIFVAMAFGHAGVNMPSIFQQIGLILFMFSVGTQAGPGFFEAFRAKGLQLVLLAVVGIVSGMLTTILFRYLFNIDNSLVTGLFTGAITSASGLAAAAEISGSPLVAIGFGLAYPFGILGIILFVRLSPRFLGISISGEEKKYEDELHSEHPELLYRNFVVENPNVIGKTLADLSIRTVTHTNISKILRNNTPITPTSDTTLERHDIIRASGNREDLNTLSYFIGPETTVEIPESKKFVVRSFLISNRRNIGKTIAESEFLHQYNATVTSIRRTGIDIVPSANTRLRFGDKVTLSAPDENIPKIGKVLGDSREELDEIDFLPIAVGVLLGVFIGQIQIPLGNGLEFSLGLTGGVLISALILSKIGKTGNIVWNISGTTNQYLRKLGLIFFLAYIGTEAGAKLGPTIHEHGYGLILVGAVISLVPMFTAVIFGRMVLNINYLSLLGAITGSMTSTPALSAVEPLTRTNAPQEAYAAVYPLSLVLIIIVSQVLVSL